MRYTMGTCAICMKEEVSSKHYSSTHNIRIRDHLLPSGRYTPPHLQPLTCKICSEKVLGSHEAVKHLLEKHPKVISQKIEGREVIEMPQEVDKVTEAEEAMKLQTAMADATIGGVFNFLIDQRKKAEAKLEFVKLSRNTSEENEEKLRQALARISELEGENTNLREENTRLAKDNKELYSKCEKAYRDVKVTQEQREALADYRKK